MKAGVIVFPGSNCDQDLVDALTMCGVSKVVKLWHKEPHLDGCDIVFLPGGFSFGDYLRSGAIARFSPIMKEVSRFASSGGYIMGICNGFQILTEAGLLPGALLHNQTRLFICDYVWLSVQNTNTLITRCLEPGVAYQIPIAHGEGRFYAPPAVLESMKENGQILFQYCDIKGRVNAESNPNGSAENIAGICNRQRNVFGMMPHPERVVDPRLGGIDGRLIFKSILESAIFI